MTLYIYTVSATQMQRQYVL